jgi:Protein of unknown function (DUF2911)
MRSITQSVGGGVRFMCGGAVLALLLAVAATSHGANHVTYLTFSRDVQVPGAVLPAGTYTFQALQPDIVRVSSRDGRNVFYTGFTHTVRPGRTSRGNVTVSFKEAPAGSPAPIDVWYPEHASFGQRFIYE